MLTYLVHELWPLLENWCSRAGVLEAADLAGWELLARVLTYLVHDCARAVAPTRKLVLQTWSPRGCRPGVLEAADLAGWELLARMLTYLVEELWPLLEN